MFNLSIKCLSQPIAIVGLAYLFLISIHLPTALATAEIDDIVQLQFEVFGGTTDNDFESLQVPLLGQFQGVGICFMECPDGELRIYEVVFAIDITTMVQEILQLEGDTLPEGDTHWSTLGWMETIDGQTVPVSALVVSSAIDGDMLRLTCGVPAQVLYALVSSASTIVSDLSTQLPNAGLIEVAPPILQSGECSIMDDELFVVTSDLQNSLTTEREAGVIEQAMIAYEFAGMAELTCEEIRDNSLAGYATIRDNAIQSANDSYATLSKAMVAGLVATLAGLAATLSACIAAAKWAPGVHAKALVIAGCVAAHAAVAGAAMAAMVMLLEAAKAARDSAIDQAKLVYAVFKAIVNSAYADCLIKADEDKTTELSMLFDSLSFTSREAILDAQIAVQGIFAYFDRSCSAQNDNNIVNGIFLGWPESCFE